MPEDDGWPEDMPPVNESLGLDDGDDVDDDIAEELADAIDEVNGPEQNDEEDGEYITLVIDGAKEIFFSKGGCERCGSDAGGVLWRESNDVNNVTGGSYLLCDTCKEETMLKHETEGFNWETF